MAYLQNISLSIFNWEASYCPGSVIVWKSPPLSYLEDFIFRFSDSKGQISFLYNIFVSKSRESSQNILQSWRSDLQENLTEEEWSRACLVAQTQMVNANSKLLQYKWITRQYITPGKLHLFNPNIPDTCVKCKHQGSLLHSMWECPLIMCFWKRVLSLASQIINKEVPVKPKLCLLNIYPDDFVTSKNEKSLLNICFLEAKRCIACSWKKEKPCTTSQWLTGMSFYFALEKISYTSKNKLNNFWKIWKFFGDFLEKNDIEVDGWNDELNWRLMIGLSFHFILIYYICTC